MDEPIVTIIVAIIGSGVLNTLLNYAISVREKRKDVNGVEKQALRLIMKTIIQFLCLHYIERKWIYADELDDLIAMHKCYHDGLNGNGYLDELMSRVKSLEIRGIEVKNK